ncbi:MAG: bifunctional (p)ppGpp synthetase/guanosine-3',5'-bis(diphosphate) 3'-pyrophosphohydrolase [Saprospirales bacterium]|nr:bifunctional (p)ppGpp synthetase/guanosine-3',5'-bis(diphosphate) 3'-pyrophosphohydrolase [Saprospirales bacterium]
MMTTQDLYQQAMKFAGEKHSEQLVPGSNANYLLHIANVSMEILLAHRHTPDFDLDFAMQTAILHDTLEDTETSFDEIADTFGPKIAEAVLALTKDPAIPSKKERMMDSLRRINEREKEVGIVKLADRITNLQEPPDTWKMEKVRAYLEEAAFIAEALKNKHGYLSDRLALKIREYEKHTFGTHD